MSKFFTFILISLSFMSLFSYILFSSQASSLGYTLDEKSEQLADLQERKNKTIVELANIQTPTSLTEYSETLQLVEATEISGYINSNESDLGLSNR